ncbi:MULTISPECIES: hypothetical protein [Moraxella]|uniref:Uncharacterized protein n=1 Tax=Moraxella nasicaprae TaxID=2904122 RepID=A0ABY6F2X1_9GAMM|nr:MULTISPECIES: hypothetical protein [Moraxella]MDO4895174.1 hypothetical protein [Moraxella sp.]UXZ04446.1 hypothetical protein LU297_07585 [Moraxella nasicaprae]
MLAQLQALEQTILAMKKQYAVTATELANLKQKIANDTTPQLVDGLQSKLNQANQDLHNQQIQNKSLEESRNALQKQVEELYEANQNLLKQNQELKDKNALAISRAEIIRDWLSQIDHQK